MVDFLGVGSDLFPDDADLVVLIDWVVAAVAEGCDCLFKLVLVAVAVLGILDG